MTHEHSLQSSAQLCLGEGCFALQPDLCVDIDDGPKSPFHHVRHRLGSLCVKEQCMFAFQVVPPEFVIGTYVAAGALLLLFFVWEAGPFHKTQTRESTYLFCVFMSVYVATFGARKVHDCNDLTESVFISLAFMQVFYYLLRRTVHIKILPPFFSQRGSRQGATLPLAVPFGMYAVRKMTSGIQSAARKAHHMIAPDIILCVGTLTCLLGRTIHSILADRDPYDDDDWTKDSSFKFGIVSVFIVFLYGLYRDLKLTMNRSAVRKEFQDLVNRMISSRDKASLRYVLANVSVGSMVCLSPEALEELTSHDVLATLLDTLSKAVLVDGIMKAGMGTRVRQSAIQRILCSCEEVEMTSLKNLIDGGGGFQNLYKLIFVDLTRHDIREVVVAHVERQAALARRRLGHRAGVKLLSDVDDTILCSGGAPAGCDTQYPKKALYPGALALYEACDDKFCCEKTACNLVFLSARPHVYKSYMEDVSYDLFGALVEEGSMHVCPTLLPGKFKSSVAGALLSMFRGSHGWKAAGETKYEMFLNFKRLYSEYDFIFSGDDGQGDLLAGELLLRGAGASDDERSGSGTEDEETCARQLSLGSEGPRILSVLIHQVLRTGEPMTLAPPETREPAWREDLRRQGMIFHKTFVGAAVALHRAHPDVVDVRDLERVARDAIEQFENFRVIYSEEWKGRGQIEAEQELRADLDLAAAALAPAGVTLPALSESRLTTLDSETEDELRSPLMCSH
eukprot:TRINITY_DN13553_c0_g1_i1.p1 TRINITY_DN13553_c0_g1~~TRINITY_DN13553_c0_g1_i1.p1  ORF type:complete len:752 (-),score=148.79 TRINITY_DN13553_c0_g1_i1:213-2420(-)